MRFPAIVFIVLVAILGCSSPSFAFDKALIGSWQGSGKNSDVRWDIRFGGAFTWTKQGPNGSVSASGVMTAGDGQWMKSISNEGSDSGSYTLGGPNKFTTVSGKFGRTEWTRFSSEVGSTSSSYASPAVTTNYQASIEHRATSTPGNAVLTNTVPANTVPINAKKHGSLKQFFKNVAPMVGAAADIAAGSDSSNYATSFYPPSMGSAGGGGSQNNFGLGRLAGIANGGGGGDAHSLLINNFPLPAGADEAERFGLPGLGRLAGGGMRKREYRAVF